MKSLAYRSLFVVAVVSLLSLATTFAAEKRKDRQKNIVETTVADKDKPKNIVETAVAAGDFKTLAAALKAADLVKTLEGKGPFTVFAPTDAAFAKLPKGTLEDLLKPENKAKLTAILTYHVVPGKVMAADVVKLSKAKTVQGSRPFLCDDFDDLFRDSRRHVLPPSSI